MCSNPCNSVQPPTPQVQLSEESCMVPPQRLTSSVEHGLFKGRTLVFETNEIFC